MLDQVIKLNDMLLMTDTGTYDPGLEAEVEHESVGENIG